MAKKKTFLGELARGVTDIAESFADVVDGSVFGDGEQKVTNGTDGKLGQQQGGSDVSGSGNEGSTKDSKPPKLSDTFKSSDSGKEKGKAPGDSKQTEGSGEPEAS